jgi:hypothetical protein
MAKQMQKRKENKDFEEIKSEKLVNEELRYYYISQWKVEN